MNKQIIPIRGMHCRSCEIILREKLEEIDGVKNVTVSYKKSEAVIYSSLPVDDKLVRQYILDAGYGVGINSDKAWISRNPKTYLSLGVSILLVILLYTLVNRLGLFNISTANSNSASNLFVVLLVGLTAGISTCMAMSGGLILSISARHSNKHPGATAIQKFRPHLYFNLGRILSYFLLGGTIGLIGKAFQLSGTTLGVLSIAVGLVMLILGLQLTEVFPRLTNSQIALPSSLAKILGLNKAKNQEYSHHNSVLIGALTFFLPCGLTQAMQLYALNSGNFWSGALIMSVFAIGTAPGLLGIGGLVSVVRGNIARKFFVFTGVVVIALAIINFKNGLNLLEFNIVQMHLGGSLSSATSDVTMENGEQVIRMVQNSTSYSPNIFTIKRDIPVRWIIESEDSSSCSRIILLNKYNIYKTLERGQNIIIFTPTKVEKIRFSCGMGMYNGLFNVVQ